MDKLLKRQLQRYAPDFESLPSEVKQSLQEFLSVVNQAYIDFDRDRKLLESSQELSSKELLAEKTLAENKSKELEKLNKALIDAQAKMVSTSKMSALGEMAGGIAHEINTPLATIQLLSEQLGDYFKEESFDRAFATEIVGIISKTVDRISLIIKGLRKFAREGAHDPIEIVFAKQLLDDTLSFCQERIRHGNIELKMNYDENTKIECRATELSQVLLNLLNNSFDAIEPLQTPKWVEIAIIDHERETEIRLTDCGKGIPAEIQEKILQPFFTTKEIGKGTGLGLSISKGIVEGHGGKFYIDKNSANTCFVVCLPKMKLLDAH